MVNRLRMRMALQADPTVIYGLGDSFEGPEESAPEDRRPLHTYTRRGLPPTDRAAKGQASLRAALRPAQIDAYYYVSRGDGTEPVLRTLREHNRAVSEYQLRPGHR